MSLSEWILGVCSFAPVPVYSLCFCLVFVFEDMVSQVPAPAGLLCHCRFSSEAINQNKQKFLFGHGVLS